MRRCSVEQRGDGMLRGGIRGKGETGRVAVEPLAFG